MVRVIFVSFLMNKLDEFDFEGRVPMVGEKYQMISNRVLGLSKRF